MRRSPKSDNPWRPFRCFSTRRRRSNPGKQNVRDALAQDGIYSQSKQTAPGNDLDIQHAFGSQINQNRYTLDNNGNANMPFGFLCSGFRNVSTCDKGTQTDSDDEPSAKLNGNLDRRVIVKQIGHSKSCDNFNRERTFQPHTSHSFQTGKEVVYEWQTFLSGKNNFRLKDFEKTIDSTQQTFHTGNSKSCMSKGQSLSDNIYADGVSKRTTNESEADKWQKIDKNSSQSEYSHQEFPDFTVHINHGEKHSKEGISGDEAKGMKNIPYHDNNVKNHRNQWSPFHVQPGSDEMRMFCEYREPDEISLNTERSCCSTSDEADDSYEVIDWNQYNDDYKKEEVIQRKKSEPYNTPPSTPILDLSALDGYHTAPNSPEFTTSHRGERELENSTEFCVIDATSDYRNTCPEYVERHSDDVKGFDDTHIDVTSQNIANNATRCDYDQDLCCKCGKLTKSETDENKVARETTRCETGNRIIGNERFRQNKRKTVPDSRILQLETPPLISVNSLHYEADPETGRAKVIGRGSFGQVYKARFSDPMFYHLPIVIKEFNEEFTNTREIIDEAKRLLYLQDTGYVPICYGLVCFGHPNEPKYGIVQEYVGTGLTLEQMLWDNYELPLEFWFRIVVQCCEGLARFHDKGILLNDIKTNNILLEFAEHSVRIRYIDFGLATDMRGKRYKNTKSLEDFTYLAPEVRQNGKVTSRESDIYSLGYILEQINKHTGMHELTVVARLCMEREPEKRLPVRSAARLIKDHMYKLGYDPLLSLE